MIFFLVSVLSFFLLFNMPLLSKLFPSWVRELGLLLVLLCQEALCHSFQWLKNYVSLASAQILKYLRTMFVDVRYYYSRIENFVSKEEEEAMAAAAATQEMTVLDLPELTLEIILAKLAPSGLCSMASVCTSLRDRCRSDHLWERHMREKWGKVIEYKEAQKEWELYMGSRKELVRSIKPKWWMGSWLESRKKATTAAANSESRLPVESVMARYLALESGRFWFPAQVYNRENGHVGFVLSCYDAELSYDSRTDTFYARYPPHGKRLASVEEGVKWERVRAAPVATPAHNLHVSDCLGDLHPGDHVEIQWRRNKEFPYGWWYGVVGHLESCDGDEHHCRCFSSDTVILEFNQYTAESRWRRTTVNRRKDDMEEGNETDGFRGGIRKLYNKDEISTWRQLWPTDLLY